MRKGLAFILASVLILSGTVPAFAQGIKRPVPILMYHNIAEKGGEEDALNVPVDRFEEHIRLLKYRGYKTITFEQLYGYFTGTSDLPENPIIITFDDGYCSSYSPAFGILKKYGYCATVFMITDYIDKPGYLEEQMLTEMQESGVFDIQSHSASHLYSLSEADTGSMRRQIAEARDILEDILKKPVKFFCYPFGRHSGTLEGVLKAEGVNMAVTTAFGAARPGDDPLRLDRIRVFGFDTGNSLLSRIERNTGNQTKPLLQDIKFRDEDLALFINALDRGLLEAADGRVKPNEPATTQDLIKGLGLIFGYMTELGNESGQLTVETTGKIIEEFAAYMQDPGTGQRYNTSSLTELIVDTDSDGIISRRDMVRLFDSLTNTIETDREYRTTENFPGKICGPDTVPGKLISAVITETGLRYIIIKLLDR